MRLFAVGYASSTHFSEGLTMTLEGGQSAPETQPARHDNARTVGPKHDELDRPWPRSNPVAISAKFTNALAQIIGYGRSLAKYPIERRPQTIMNKLTTSPAVITALLVVSPATAIVSPGTLVGNRVGLRLASAICWAVFVGLLFATSGCGKQSSTPVAKQTDAMPVSPNTSPSDREKALMAQRQAFRQGIGPPPPAIRLKGGEPATPEILAAYNQELARAVFHERDSPESLQELQQKWITLRRLLPNLPTPPRGKRIVYDDRYHIIRLDPP